MNNTTCAVRRARTPLRVELGSWQRAAIGLLTMSVVVHTALMARINVLEVRHQQDTARIQQAEQIKDSALQELGRLTNEIAREQKEQAERAAAYEALGAYQYIGECTITYYCVCETCCGPWADGLTATGLPVRPGIVAVDPDVIELGSTVIVDGQKYLAADTGVTGHHIDVFVEDHQEAVERGVEMAEVWVER